VLAHRPWYLGPAMSMVLIIVVAACISVTGLVYLELRASRRRKARDASEENERPASAPITDFFGG
jgi:hypothetical protein